MSSIASGGLAIHLHHLSHIPTGAGELTSRFCVYSDVLVSIALPFLLFALSGQEKDPHAEQKKIDPSRVFTFEVQDLSVPDFATAPGWILDLGGGGEGIIGRIKGRQVVAIDLYSWGMRRTPPGPLKLTMDATDLKFLDHSFGTVTSFFTLMYMKPEDQEKAVREAFRVLVPGGRIMIWDVQLPLSSNPKQDIVVYRFRFHLPAEQVETGYGTSFPKKRLDLAYYSQLVRSAGFIIDDQETVGNTFRLVARRP